MYTFLVRKEKEMKKTSKIEINFGFEEFIEKYKFDRGRTRRNKEMWRDFLHRKKVGKEKKLINIQIAIVLTIVNFDIETD